MSHRATHNLLAVSASTAETAINTYQNTDTTLLVDLNTVTKLEPRRENNAGEATGKEEPDTIYDLGKLSSVSLDFGKAMPQHFAFLFAYGLGKIESSAAGTGYEHTLTPIAGDYDASRSLPGFTVAQRLGNMVMKRRFASMFVNLVTATFAADSWVKLRGDIKGTGKNEHNLFQESVSAAQTATSLTLAANGVHGATPEERLANVHQIKAETTPGVWTEVAYSVVSDASPAAITITAPGVTADVVAFKVLYVPTETGWMTFPPRVTESPLRVSALSIRLGATWNGTAFEGGRDISRDIKSIEYSLNNNMQIEFAPGAGGDYASRAFRDGRVQTLKIDKEFRDYVLQNYMDTNETFGVHVLCEGAEFDPPNKYTVELIFPMVGALSAPISVNNGKRLAEAGDLTVLEHGTYGSVIVKVKNRVATYAA